MNYKNPSIVSGISISDILSMDNATFDSLGEKPLRMIVGRLVSAGNKRLRNFEKKQETSPAERYVMEHGGMFSTKGKNLNALRAEFKRAKDFLESKSSTVKEWKKIKQETIDSLKEQNVDVDKESFDKFWKAYEELKKRDKSVGERKFKYSVLEEISNMMEENKTLSVNEIADDIEKRLSDIYEEQEENENDGTDGTSGFFEPK